MLAGNIAVTSMLGLAGCSNDDVSRASDIPERKNLTLSMSFDINQMLTNVVSFEVEMVDGQYFIKFLAHFDKGLTPETSLYTTTYTYKEHKDYAVTYKISKEEYTNFMQTHLPATPIQLKDVPISEISTLQSIIDNNDPISVEEDTKTEAKDRQHSL